MCVLEAVLLRYLDLTRADWERRSVQSVAVLGTVAVGFAAAGTSTGTLVLGALVWGLLGYLPLLATVVCRRTPIARPVGREAILQWTARRREVGERERPITSTIWIEPLGEFVTANADPLHACRMPRAGLRPIHPTPVSITHYPTY